MYFRYHIHCRLDLNHRYHQLKNFCRLHVDQNRYVVDHAKIRNNQMINLFVRGTHRLHHLLQLVSQYVHYYFHHYFHHYIHY